MTLPVISDTSRAAFNWRSVSTGQSSVNVMHFGGTNLHPDSDLMDALVAHVNLNMWFPMSSDWIVDHVSITKLDGASATTDHLAPSTAAWKGEDAGDWIPQAAALVKLQTALRGKSFRGRVYLGPVAEAGATNGSMVAGVMAGWQLGWFNFVTGMATDNFPLLVASYKLAVAHPVLNASCEPVLGTQRRRQTRLR